ncbi:lipoxygenase family protein [Anabaena sp. CA = ATCC 33047]|uniref:lipoxygenase family protein n=1 Tax=Anabaena sp. (strain CA / ATCC 33047) TaxID=52271 RepID=UPI00083683D3|nr:lipoxygenase family protein [Anabaena sp. CA = ATCC 33047]
MVSQGTTTEQKGHYRYNPYGLNQKGPARIFPYAGEDGVLRYILTKLGEDAISQGKLSEPWSLLLKQAKSTIASLDELWLGVSTKLVDLEIFQSGWFNFNLPPNEQFNASYVRQRRAMIDFITAAQKAADAKNSIEQKRSLFFQSLEKSAKSSKNASPYIPTRPVASIIHQRDGGLSDREFARQRLAGTNPMVLRRVKSADQGLLQAWANIPTNVDLIESAAANRLFIVDYPLFKDLKVTDLQVGKYVGSPVALFHRSEAGLEPILIEVEKGRIVTPTVTGTLADDWTRAKLSVQTTDVTHHELISHLCYTHLAMEAFAIATARQLPNNHPVSQLLSPHFQFLIAVNDRANTILLEEGAAINKLTAPTISTSVNLINQAYRNKIFWDYALPNDIEHRGIETKFLPEYPYRDDSLLLWEAIAKYTKLYLQRYYVDDQAVIKDSYLQAWADELSTPLNTRPKSEFPQVPAWFPQEWAIALGLQPQDLPSHPRVPGFTKITSLQQLIDIATIIIFTCGPQHAAINYSQFDYLGYVPNAPLANYSRPDTPVSLPEFLPPADREVLQMRLTFALNAIYWGKLGSSELINFTNRSDQEILTQFQNDLMEIENKIKARNQKRLADTGVDYPYLLPSRIPNSINI